LRDRLDIPFALFLHRLRRSWIHGIAVAHILRRKLVRAFKKLHLVRLFRLLRRHSILRLQLVNPFLQFRHADGIGVFRYEEVIKRSLYLLILHGRLFNRGGFGHSRCVRRYGILSYGRGTQNAVLTGLLPAHLRLGKCFELVALQLVAVPVGQLHVGLSLFRAVIRHIRAEDKPHRAEEDDRHAGNDKQVFLHFLPLGSRF